MPIWSRNAMARTVPRTRVGSHREEDQLQARSVSRSGSVVFVFCAAVRAGAFAVAFFFALVWLLSGCGDPAPEEAPASVPASEKNAAVTLVLGVFAGAREPYEKRILPLFKNHWQRVRGQEVTFVESYAGSGTQASAIARGFEADVAVLSLAEDIDLLVRSGLIRHDWRMAPHRGIVSRSLVVLAVPKGNPGTVQDWPDLLRPGLRIVTPDPRSSGGGRWNVSAIYGAALRGRAGVPAGDPGLAERFLAEVLGHVVSLEKDAAESFRKFEEGEGDVAITYESEVIQGRMFGHEYERVIPSSTLLVENPAAVVDRNAEKHGVREVAEAFVQYLWTKECQRKLGFCGMRPVDPAVAAEYVNRFPRPKDPWTIEALGGWERVSREIVGPGGVLERALALAAVKAR